MYIMGDIQTRVVAPYSRGLNRRETLTRIMDAMNATYAMCPDVRFYPDPVLLCRAGLGSPRFFCLCCVRHHLKVGPMI